MIDQCTGNVTGHHVWQELDAAKTAPGRLPQGADQLGFGQPWYPLDEHMAIGEQGDEEFFDKCCLTKYDFRYLINNGGNNLSPGCLIGRLPTGGRNLCLHTTILCGFAAPGTRRS